LGADALVSDTRSYLGLARSRPKTLARLRARLAVVHDDSYRSRRFQIVLDDWMRLDLAGQILDDRHLTAEEFDRLTGRYRLSGPPAYPPGVPAWMARTTSMVSASSGRLSSR
jgi:hypothetical protein